MNGRSRATCAWVWGRRPGAGLLAFLAACGPALAQTYTESADAPFTTTTKPAEAAASARPKIKSNRWQEDWSPLADPALRTQPLDGLKYIPLDPFNAKSYVSFGANLRERFESNNAQGFGVGTQRADSYVIQRFQFSMDAHLNENWQIFTQFEDDRAFGKRRPLGPVDEDKLDLRLAFVGYQGAAGSGTFKARAGRQDFAFDLQRFVSSRDGPNVRQSFDALWGDYEVAPWRFIGFVSQPVQYRSDTPFDDYSNRHWRFHTLRIERQVLGTNELSGYYSRWEQDRARFLDATGDERRDILDVRFAGALGAVDWDLEAMGQSGQVGTKDVRAWALGARAGYTFQGTPWTPRLGIQADAASGDRHPGDGRLETFNPLFPNGYYFSLAGYTGYTNLLHLKPTLTVKPTSDVTLLAGVGLQWRQSEADAIYTQPNVPVAGTAGRPGRWSGAYFQGRVDWTVNANITAAVEAVHFEAGSVIKSVGGKSSDYLGAEVKYSW